MIPVKICGITRLEDALAAVGCGAQALGFIFWPESPRYVAPEAAARIVAGLPPFVVTVGVFVAAPLEEINAVAERCRLDRIQLHGGEPFELLARLARPGYRVFRPRDAAELAAVEAAPDRTVHLDTYHPELYGGTGHAADWAGARRLAEALGRAGRRVILSGGLTPENIAQAVQAVRPHALDVSSGVEAAPGSKDPAKIAALFRALSGAEPNLTPRSGAHAFANP
jgi:phosphoribosylanthranilate isomerase